MLKVPDRCVLTTSVNSQSIHIFYHEDDDLRWIRKTGVAFRRQEYLHKRFITVSKYNIDLRDFIISKQLIDINPNKPGTTMIAIHTLCINLLKAGITALVYFEGNGVFKSETDLLKAKLVL